MNIETPPGGFKIIIEPVVTALVDDLLPSHPELSKHWRAVIARLKDAGHLAGEPVDGNPTQRVGIIQPYYNGPIFWLAWRVSVDTVHVLRAQF
jgi:hypothetical protein